MNKDKKIERLEQKLAKARKWAHIFLVRRRAQCLQVTKAMLSALTVGEMDGRYILTRCSAET